MVTVTLIQNGLKTDYKLETLTQAVNHARFLSRMFNGVSNEDLVQTESVIHIHAGNPQVVSKRNAA